MGQTYSPMPQSQRTRESSKTTKNGAVETSTKFSLKDSKTECAMTAQQLTTCDLWIMGCDAKLDLWQRMAGKRCTDAIGNDNMSVHDMENAGESGRANCGRVSLQLNGEVELKSGDRATGFEVNCDDSGEFCPVEVNQVMRRSGFDQETNLMNLSKQRRPSLPEFMRDWPKLRVEHRACSSGSNIHTSPFDGMIENNSGYPFLTCSSTDHLAIQRRHILHNGSLGDGVRQAPSDEGDARKHSKEPVCDDVAQVAQSGEQNPSKAKWNAEDEVLRQHSRPRSKNIQQQENQREISGRTGTVVNSQLLGQGLHKIGEGRGKCPQNSLRESSDEEFSVKSSRAEAVASMSTCGRGASAIVCQRQRYAPGALESKLRENLERMLMRELQEREQEMKGRIGRGTECKWSRTADDKENEEGRVKEVVEGKGKRDARGDRWANWRQRKTVRDGNDDEKVASIDLKESSAWKNNKEGDTRLELTNLSPDTMETTTKVNGRIIFSHTNAATHKDHQRDHQSTVRTGDIPNNTVARNQNHFKECDPIALKGVSPYCSDASSFSCVEASRTLHRSVIRELLDGEIEIHRSNTILACASSATPSSKPKPVALVQPRKVTGVRVLPPPAAAIVQAISKPRSLQLKPPFSGPRRQRNIQRAPAIRSSKPYIAPRHQMVYPAVNQDSQEFQRVGLRLRSVNRSTRQRQSAKETTTWTTQAGFEARYFLQDSKRFRLRQLASAKDGNWKTATREAMLKATKEMMPSPAVDVAGKTKIGANLDERMTETLLQTKKKDAEIAALLLQVLKDKQDGESKRTSSDFENSSLISMQTNLESSLGYFP